MILKFTEDSVLVRQNAGPLGGPGMPEWGMLPIPRKLLLKGVRELVRIPFLWAETHPNRLAQQLDH